MTVDGFARVIVTARAFDDQNQVFLIDRNESFPPISVAHRAAESRLQFRAAGKGFRAKNLVGDLKEEVIFLITPEEEQGVGQGRSKAQLQVRTRMGAVLDVPAMPLRLHDLEVDEPWDGEGEGGACGTEVVVEARWTRARVTVFLLFFSQPREAGGAVLALVLHAARQLDLAVVPPPGEVAGFWLRTAAGVGVHAVFALASVLTRLTFTLIGIHLTKITWKQPIRACVSRQFLLFNVSKIGLSV